MGRNILLGFAGPGEVSAATAKDLLGDYLQLGPEDDKGLPAFADNVDSITAVVPVGEKYLTPTVELLLEWIDWADLPYEAVFDRETRDNRKILDDAEKAIEARNIGSVMIDRLVEGRKNGDDVALIVAWGEAGDDYTEMLVDLAMAKEIPVLDINAGLDDAQPKLEELVFGSGKPEPEPEPEKPRRRRTAKTAEPEEKVEATEPDEEPKPSRRGRPRKVAETAPEATAAAESTSVEQDVAKGRQAAQKPVSADDDVIRGALRAAAHFVTAHDAMAAAMNGSDDVKSSTLSTMLAEALEAYQPPVPKGGRPRKDGTPAQPRTPEARAVKEWQNEDGEWIKAGRGRLPKGVHTRTVDPKTAEVLSED